MVKITKRLFFKKQHKKIRKKTKLPLGRQYKKQSVLVTVMLLC